MTAAQYHRRPGFAASVRNMRAAFEYFRQHPEGRVNFHAPGRVPASYTHAEYRQWFRRCLTDKINRQETPRGRKDSEEFYYEIQRISRDLNARIIVREGRCNWLRHTEPKMYARIAHRIYKTEDF